mmetsp:Transcript_46245/g.91659  ORF Transcript_46245/g.91659 Transcript_46245/m.91659 type:complete len:561 (+) Transcript_46245:120-1802(+)
MMKTKASIRVIKTVVRTTRSACIAAALAWVLYCIKFKLFRRIRNKPCMPGRNWLFGNFPYVLRAAFRNKLHEYLCEGHKAVGPTLVGVTPLFVPVNVVVTTDPRNIEHILKTNFDNYPKGKNMTHRFFDLLGRGIFNVDGQEWYHQRKTTSHMFTAKIFKEHIWAVVLRNSAKLCNILQGVEVDKSVDVFNLMNRFTLDTIGEVGFGKCIGSLDDPSSPFLSSFDRAQQICVFRFIVPPLTWEVMRFFQVGTERDTNEHLSRLDTYTRGVVRDLRKNCERGSDKSSGVAWSDLQAEKSFVGLFLADAAKRGVSVSEDYLRDLVLNFLIAGRDTTAQALSWALFCLCTHPEVEVKAREEAMRMCGSRRLSYEDLNQLTYLQAVMSETLRLYPSVPIDSKQVKEDDVWPDGTLVPKDTVVWYNIYSMGRDTSIWGADAELFRPERWLEMSTLPDNYHYPVFNGGPRECLGKRLAMVEMKTCLAMLLSNVSLKLAVPAHEICTDIQLTIGMGRGLPCYVTSISDGEDVKSSMSTTAQSENESIGAASDIASVGEPDVAATNEQ